MRHFLPLCLLCLPLVGLAPGAVAHPHVWMDLDMVLLTDKGALTGFDITWTWDEVYSDPFRKTYDKNHNGKFDPAEAAELQKKEITSLAAFSDFVFVHVKGERVPVGTLKNLTIDLKGDQMQFHFQVPLKQPIPLAGVGSGHTLTVGSYDPEYYIESTLPEDRPGIRFAAPPAGCTIKIIEDRKHPIYFGMVYPQVGSVTCAE